MLEELAHKLEKKLARHEELGRQMADPAIASNPEQYSVIAREYGPLGRLVTRYKQIKQLSGQISDAEQLLEEPDMKEMAEEELKHLRSQREEQENELTDLLLAGPESDRSSLIVEIRAGTGGEEAALFARDLQEMYRRYAEIRGWKVEVLDFSVSEQRGYKEIIFSVTGQDAYRELCFESGGHRVQRVPETEAQGRIHTSAATVAVLAEPEEVEVKIRSEDIEMEAIRSSGPGGQHVNKTSSAVRITHKPTGLVVFCQDERSQHKNRAKAMRLLRSRLFDRMQQEQHSKRAQLRKSLIKSGDRSERIRTYNFPQNRCTDHRIGKNFNLEEVIAGSLGKLVETLQEHDRKERLAAMVKEL